MMASFGSPKRRKETLNWEQCIICQCSNAEPVICMRDVSKVDVEGISDEQILHSAVGILRCDIEKLKISVDDYPKSQSTSRLL